MGNSGKWWEKVGKIRMENCGKWQERLQGNKSGMFNWKDINMLL